MLNSLLNLIFPKTCVGCGKFGAYFCSKCTAEIYKKSIKETICPVCTRPAVGGAVHPRCQTRYSPDGLTAFFRYDGPVRKAIKLLKYRRISDLTSELSNLLINAFTDKKELYVSMSRFIQNTNPNITAIPLYKTRERQRWFNQSELVAKKLSEQLDFQFSHDLLIRTKFSKPQAGLLRKDRLVNMKGSFAVNLKRQLQTSESLILVDDVWTTGATMREAVNVLKRNGVKKVWCMTVAR